MKQRSEHDRRTVPRGFGVGAAALAAVLLAGGCADGGRAGGDAAGGRSTAALARLPQATTSTTVAGLPEDTAPFATSDGTVVHPRQPVPVSARPDGEPVAMLPDKQLGGPTWVPVVESRPGWRRVLLPNRPNRATGWIADRPGVLDVARSTQVVRVDLGDRRLTIEDSGRKVGSWTVAVGAPKTPTPTGRTFILASLKPTEPTHSPLILPVGAHSETLDTYGGGPGTVAFHTWPDASVFGKAVTHGCVRVPRDALARLAKVPLGSPVIVTA
ncbi:hypothetical protein Arub01_57590 [Actinomadura rubrobrunea]|uniref:L,D-TPase catalytic domain-containing protein n=1 Tax=Actinomadura rubrobrunea TaxID=115335 RepID=A0A9W6UXB7_9ACTN|nr:L,D-transpeptidase [Actinomadura rubrobrunea]GLW67516.1 hypothetical protein Arub01_57590 [Actinomadura rubrobrunea]